MNFDSRSYTRMPPDVLDLPAQISSTYNDIKSDDAEMQPPVEEDLPSDSQLAWQLNYNEAAIYLEEGENNDKFDYHPRSKKALPAYLLVHNTWFYLLDLLSALMLLFLAILEKPSVPGFETTEGIHGSLELLLLSVMCVEMAMKFRWMGLKPFMKHKRTLTKLMVLIVMVIEAIVVLIRQTSHFRVTRALRPVFLIDNHFCGGVRRVIRQILQSLPPIIDMLFLLLFFVLIFSVLGFYSFSSNTKDPYFASLPGSFVSLFVLLTTANYPDVMMPSYAKSRWSFIYFMAFLVIHVYFLMNLMLAVVYETFTTIEKKKFRKLLLHRRKACWHAFHLLVSRSSPGQIVFSHFEGLMQFYKPHASREDIYLMFKTLDSNKSGTINLEEFYHIYEISALKWKIKKLDQAWFVDIANARIKRFIQLIHKLITWKWTDFIINLIIIANGMWQLLEAIELSNLQAGHLDSYAVTSHVRVGSSLSSWISLAFLVFYSLEMMLKLIGLGFQHFFQSGWNTYDFVVTAAAVAGLIAEHFNLPFSFVIILRPLRLLRLFKMKKRYRDVLGTVFILLPRFLSVSLILILVYYAFAILGIELFSTYNMRNCCKNTTVEQFFKYKNDSLVEGYYYLNNFENLIASGVTLFELMVVNNWFILMDGYAVVATEWSRIFFMLFYIVTMVVLNIILAFILEAFLFRIQYKRQMGDMDKDSLVKVDINLCNEELQFCKGSTAYTITDLMNIEESAESCVLYRGTRNRTKFSFSQKMYGEEVKEWIEEADREERLRLENLLLAHNINSSDEAESSEALARRSVTV